MRDTCHYTNIYTTKYQELMFLKEGGSYSFLKMDICEEDPDVKSYTEVIVPAAALEDALLDMPSSDESSFDERMQLLFGSSEGFDHFISYCDENGIDTQTLFWD